MSSTDMVLRFRSYDGVSLEGTQCSPILAPRPPAALLVHGIDSDRDELGFYSRMATTLADAGYASFRFDWRCYGYDKARPINELTLAGVVNDISAAAACFRRSLGTTQLVIIGTSFGGGLSAYWARHDRDVSGVALLCPVLDYGNDYLTLEGHGDSVTGVNNDAAEQLQRSGSLVTSGRSFSRAMIAELPHFAARPLPELPILLAHGDADKAVPFRLSEALSREHPRITFVRVANADHGFAAPGDDDLDQPETLANQSHVYGRIMTWMEHLA